LQEAGLPDFSWCNIPKRGKIYQMTTKHGHIIYQIAVNIYKLAIQFYMQTFSTPRPPTFPQMEILGMKIYHLASLA
jgi:hypothetical protein